MSAPSQHVICDWFKIYILRCTSITLRRDGQRAATDGQKNQSPTFQPRRNANFLFNVRVPEGRNSFSYIYITFSHYISKLNISFMASSELFSSLICVSLDVSRMINPSNPAYNIWRHNASTLNVQVPEGGNRSLYIPYVNTSEGARAELDSCREYRDPTDHARGTRSCSSGHAFQFEGENEWTVTAEVSAKNIWITAEKYLLYC